MIEDYKEGRMISSLVFDNVTQEDFGEYSCNATNTLGQVRYKMISKQIDDALA